MPLITWQQWEYDHFGSKSHYLWSDLDDSSFSQMLFNSSVKRLVTNIPWCFLFSLVVYLCISNPATETLDTFTRLCSGCDPILQPLSIMSWRLLTTSQTNKLCTTFSNHFNLLLLLVVTAFGFIYLVQKSPAKPRISFTPKNIVRHKNIFLTSIETFPCAVKLSPASAAGAYPGKLS